MLEIEVKLRLTDAAAFRALLGERGWTPATQVFERNTIYDTPDKSLYAGGRLLRIREIDKRAIVTVKLPSANRGIHKVREEHQFETDNIVEAQEVFAGLGYEPAWIYEKRRTTFRKDGQNGIIEVDQTPIGDFAEFEGTADWIDQAAHDLGFEQSEYVLDSYRALFEAWREQTGSDVEHMTFD